MKRRNFIKDTAITAASLALFQNTARAATDSKVKIGLIGTGLRGQNHLELLLKRNDVDLVAICDVDERMLSSAKNIITKSGRNMPQVYTGDDYAWKRLLEKEKLDSVVIAS